MNKILIALVLAVGLSGNVYSDQGEWVYFYCDSEWNEGYYFNKNNFGYIYESNGSDVRYHQGTDQILQGTIEDPRWSPSYVEWSHPIRGNFRINRKTLKLEHKSLGNSYYKINSQCYLIDDFQDLKKLVKENYFKKIKGNKF